MMKLSKFPKWREAMKNKIQALEQNKTWCITEHPHRKRKTHWTYMGL